MTNVLDGPAPLSTSVEGIGQHRSRGEKVVVMTAPDATADVAQLAELTARAEEAFRSVQQRVFADDPAVNGHLAVEAVDAALVERVPTLVLITPWTLNGLLFPCDEGPAELYVAGAFRRAYRGDVAPLGVYWSVPLVPDVSRLSGPRQARTLASSFAGPFRDGVRTWLAARAPDPDLA